jgi:uncharacterized protein YjiS (DUF1127 family)
MINGPAACCPKRNEIPLVALGESRLTEAEGERVMVASDCTTDRSTRTGDRLVEAAAAAWTWTVAFWRTAQNRRSVARLLEWDERMLRDIGLTRGDVCAVMALPAGQDPSWRLRDLSSERRAAMRASARERAGLVGLARRDSRSRPPQSKSFPFPYL